MLKERLAGTNGIVPLKYLVLSLESGVLFCPKHAMVRFSESQICVRSFREQDLGPCWSHDRTSRKVGYKIQEHQSGIFVTSILLNHVGKSSYDVSVQSSSGKIGGNQSATILRPLLKSMGFKRASFG